MQIRDEFRPGSYNRPMKSGTRFKASRELICRTAGHGDDKCGGGWVVPSSPVSPFGRLAKGGRPSKHPLIKATNGRLKLSPNLPMVVLTSLGARSGEHRIGSPCVLH